MHGFTVILKVNVKKTANVFIAATEFKVILRLLGYKYRTCSNSKLFQSLALMKLSTSE